MIGPCLVANCPRSGVTIAFRAVYCLDLAMSGDFGPDGQSLSKNPSGNSRLNLQCCHIRAVFFTRMYLQTTFNEQLNNILDCINEFLNFYRCVRHFASYFDLQKVSWTFVKAIKHLNNQMLLFLYMFCILKYLLLCFYFDILLLLTCGNEASQSVFHTSVLVSLDSRPVIFVPPLPIDRFNIFISKSFRTHFS